ncbi:MAG: Wzz/FepE/Etk N-terminal domain-containing protein, partial [Candidatus Syntrophosphaera sp.]
MTSQQNQNQTKEIKLSDYLRILLQYRYLIILIFILALAVTIVYTYRQPRIYSTSARILLENQATGAEVLLLTNQGSGKNYINNQIEQIKTKPVLNAAWEIMKKNPDWESYPISTSSNPAGNLARVNVESKRDTDILTLSFESTHPGEAMAAANAIADAVQQQNTQLARLEYTTIREFLGEQLDLISRRLQISEDDLRAFKNENRLVELTETTSQWIEQSAEIESEYEAALTDLAVKARTVDVLRSQLADQD